MFEVRNLSAAYGQSQVLHGIDLSVGPGEIVALVGPQWNGQVHVDEIMIGVMPPARGRSWSTGRT